MDILARFLTIMVVCGLLGVWIGDRLPRWVSVLIGGATAFVIYYLWGRFVP